LKIVPAIEPHGGLSRLTLFFALSRTPHALLEMATPGLASLIWLGTFPPLRVILLGLMTVFAGYTSVYALNDLMGYRSDRKKMKRAGMRGSGDDLDALMVRHPLARGLLRFRDTVLWVLAWGVLALVGAYILNPICILIFIGGFVLEAFYCLLWRVSPFRTIVSGAVKTSAAIAALFAVDSNPSFVFLFVLFLWLFFWEIGGQNVPNDWADIEEDIHIKAKTIPLRFGPDRAKVIVLGSLILCIIANVILLRLAPFRFGLPCLGICLFLGIFFLIVPAYRLYKTKEPLHALILFNRASIYPLSLLTVVALKLAIS
jgi:4-hydroxybenzoate polyprenyltransferase